MNLKIYFILFVLYSIFGWICEEFATYDKEKGFINRGFLIGPYCPIYGFSALIMVLILNRFTNPYVIFILSLTICTTIEYLASYFMELIFNARWWDYTNNRFNIEGRVCLKNAICFGFMGLILIKFVNPFLETIILRFSPFTISIIFYIMLLLYILDNILSFKLILKIKKENVFKKRDNTREIVAKGKEILSKSLFGKKLIIIFPQKIKEQKEKIKNEVKKQQAILKESINIKRKKEKEQKEKLKRKIKKERDSFKENMIKIHKKEKNKKVKLKNKIKKEKNKVKK